MRFIFDTKYSEMELEFMNKHNCKILSEIRLSKTNFSENEIPLRMFKYGNEYIAEIYNNESNEIVWGILIKWKGVYSFSSYYDDLEVLEQNL